MRIICSAGVSLVAVLLLAGCSSAPESSPVEPVETDSSVINVTSEVLEVAGDRVLSAEETEPGRVDVFTNIVDPRGDNGSSEAQTAIAICEAVKSLGYEKVQVLEEDGTNFVIAGHPTYGETCTEV